MNICNETGRLSRTPRTMLLSSSHLRLESSRCHTKALHVLMLQKLRRWNVGATNADESQGFPTPLLSVGFRTFFNWKLSILAERVTQASILNLRECVQLSALRICHKYIAIRIKEAPLPASFPTSRFCLSRDSKLPVSLSTAYRALSCCLQSSSTRPLGIL